MSQPDCSQPARSNTQPAGLVSIADVLRAIEALRPKQGRLTVEVECGYGAGLTAAMVVVEECAPATVASAAVSEGGDTRTVSDPRLFDLLEGVASRVEDTGFRDMAFNLRCHFARGTNGAEVTALIDFFANAAVMAGVTTWKVCCGPTLKSGATGTDDAMAAVRGFAGPGEETKADTQPQPLDANL